MGTLKVPQARGADRAVFEGLDRDSGSREQSKTADAMLVNDAGELFPAGRALVGGLSPSVDCSTGTD